MNRKNVIRILLLWCLLALLWLITLVETTTLTSYNNFFTSGELFAWLTANRYEVNDIAGYCIRYVIPYWILCTLIFCFLGWGAYKIVKSYSRKAFVGSLIIELLLLMPFTVLPLRCNLLRESLMVARQINNIKEHQHDSSDFRYGAQRTDKTERKEIYVLAVGESLRYKNLSLNGIYERKTTPLLEQQKNLCLYADYYASATLTQHAMPTLLTPATADNFTEHFRYKSIAAAFDEAGFRTALVSHRAQLMNNDYHNYLAQDFDTLIFVGHDSLIAPMVRQLTDENEKLFIVTHYLGNHMFYTNRTDDYLIWRPDYNADSKVKSDSLFLNAYDNSILYTDRLLSEQIKVLENIDAVSCWLFISDHGEYISNKVSGHGHTYHPTKEEYHVPLMVWYSDEYKKTYPEKVANMTRHKDEPISGDNVFWSVLDMAGIQLGTRSDRLSESEIRIRNEKLEMSIFSSTLLPHERTLLLPDGQTLLQL